MHPGETTNRPSPLHNRVRPDGEIVAVSARGTLMGNRGGRLHDNETKLLHPSRRWASRQWISCVTQFKQRQRELMAPNRYTELFFLDEITALAAGHRPCFECRRTDAKAFANAWRRAMALSKPPRAGEMDAVLHGERLSQRTKRLHGAAYSSLPDGAVFQLDDALLTRCEGAVYEWHFTGWEMAECTAPSQVKVLTPPTICKILDAGYQPLWHHSAETDAA